MYSCRERGRMLSLRCGDVSCVGALRRTLGALRRTLTANTRRNIPGAASGGYGGSWGGLVGTGWVEPQCATERPHTSGTFFFENFDAGGRGGGGCSSAWDCLEKITVAIPVVARIIVIAFPISGRVLFFLRPCPCWCVTGCVSSCLVAAVSCVSVRFCEDSLISTTLRVTQG